MGGFLPVDEESDSLPPKVKNPVDQDRDFEVGFPDLDLPGDFPDFSVFEEWFDNLPPGSLEFWSSMDRDSDVGRAGDVVPVKVEEGEGDEMGDLCRGGGVTVKIEEGEGDKINALGFGGGAVSVKVEECEVGDVGIVGDGVCGRGEGVNDVEVSVEREMRRVSLGCPSVELGGGNGSGAAKAGLKIVGIEGVCVKTELAGKDGKMDDDSVVTGGFVVESNEKVDDGRQACEDVQSGDTKEGERGISSDKSSSSLSSSDSDEKNEDIHKVDGTLEKRGGVKADERVDEMEEGEIRDVDERELPAEKAIRESESDDDDGADEMADWCVVETEIEGFQAFSDDETEVTAGPIMSKNELKVLPPVPSVSVRLEPHHEMMPIGPVLSIVELQVVVEGCLKHNPLNEGSILWISESRSPLGFIDEIFGPVKNPYYLIRYNSKAEIPAGIKEGTLISSVPEYASYVLNQKDLYKKGYDLSGKNDEEVSEDEEFSDDEKEAEYKRMQRMAKRDTDMTTQKPGNRKVRNKKDNGRNPNWKPGTSTQQMPTTQSRVHLNGNQDYPPTRPAPTDSGNSASSSTVQAGSFGGNNEVPQFPFQTHIGGNSAHLFNPSLLSGLPLQGPAGAVLFNAISNAMLLPGKSSQFPFETGRFPQQPMAPPNQVPCQLGFDPNQNMLANLVATGAQSNPFGNPASAPWSGPIPPNSFNPAGVGMSPAGQLDPNSILFLANALGIHLGGGQSDPNFNTMALPPPVAPMPPQPMQGYGQFNLGASSGRGNRPFRRGGGRLSAGRGRGRPN